VRTPSAFFGADDACAQMAVIQFICALALKEVLVWCVVTKHALSTAEWGCRSSMRAVVCTNNCLVMSQGVLVAGGCFLIQILGRACSVILATTELA
jgi:hypothetical protein